MSRFPGREARTYLETAFRRVRPLLSGAWARLIELAPTEWVRERFEHRFATHLPPLAITCIEPPALLVMMAGTTVRQYTDAGQFGRLSAALNRHTRYFRTVVLMTNDRYSFTSEFESDRIRHIGMRVPVPGAGLSLMLSTLFRARTIRRMRSIVILDEQAAPAGRLASRISGSPLSMSVGARWAPPRDSGISGVRRWLTRSSVRRVGRIIEWRPGEAPEAAPGAEQAVLPDVIDTDLYCPLLTTDPERPRVVGVFLSAEHESDARVTIGAAERLNRRGIRAVIQVLVTGRDAESRCAAWQADANGRDVGIEFKAVPVIEMLPDVISRLRICVAFDGAGAVRNLLSAMASGVPAIAVRHAKQESDAVDIAPGWSRFVLKTDYDEEQITRSIEALFREPGVRLRLAREGRRYVIAKHSLDAVSARESMLLLEPGPVPETEEDLKPDEFDAEAEAEKLAQLLESIGVTRVGSSNTSDSSVAA